MIKKYWVYLLFGIAVTVFSITQYNKYTHTKIEVKTKQNKLGWGYEIYVKNKIFITQDFIPSVSGNKVFATENDAKQVGELMVFKMNKNQIPNVTEHELDSLHITR